MLLLYVCVLLIYASTHFLRNKSVQEKEKVNMLHKAENLYFNVTVRSPIEKTKAKRIGQKNVISYGFSVVLSNAKAPGAVQKTHCGHNII